MASEYDYERECRKIDEEHETMKNIKCLDNGEYKKDYLERKETEKELEILADLEHQQWIEWSKTISRTENISKERLARWKESWVSYNLLSFDVQELDRKWARKVLKIIEQARQDERKKCEKMIDDLIIDMSGKDNIKEATEYFEFIRHLPRYTNDKRLFEEIHKSQLGILFRIKEVELNNLKINQIPKNDGKL